MLFVELLLILVEFTAELGASSTPTACSNNAKLPPEEDMKKMYNQWLTEDDGFHKTFFNWSPLYYEKIKRLRSMELLTVFETLITDLDTDRECSKNLNRETSDLRHNSLCPWYVVLTLAADRYPKEMPEAVCKCLYCYNLNGIMRRRRRIRKPRNDKAHRQQIDEPRLDMPRCKEMKQLFKVIKARRDPDGKPVCLNNADVYSIQKTYQEIAVGCTCSFDSITTIQKIVTQT